MRTTPGNTGPGRKSGKTGSKLRRYYGEQKGYSLIWEANQCGGCRGWRITGCRGRRTLSFVLLFTCCSPLSIAYGTCSTFFRQHVRIFCTMEGISFHCFLTLWCFHTVSITGFHASHNQFWNENSISMKEILRKKTDREIKTHTNPLCA